jgi:hypothetical protein
MRVDSKSVLSAPGGTAPAVCPFYTISYLLIIFSKAINPVLMRGGIMRPLLFQAATITGLKAGAHERGEHQASFSTELTDPTYRMALSSLRIFAYP